MHELSIAENIVEIAVAHLRADGGSSVKEIELEIGTLAGIEIDALTFAMDSATKNTPLQNAEVRILTVQGRLRCDSCSVEFDANDFFQPCTSCGSFDNITLQGEEMRVKTLLVQE
ncbi:MAG: hydrogenase maturation nickel metallochaperone HypA [Bacteroidota bacterium]